MARDAREITSRESMDISMKSDGRYVAAGKHPYLAMGCGGPEIMGRENHLWKSRRMKSSPNCMTRA